MILSFYIALQSLSASKLGDYYPGFSCVAIAAL